MKKILLTVFYFFISICVYADKSQRYETNISANPNGIDLFLSSITYTQEEKDKRFTAKMKIPFSRDFLINMVLESSEISDNIGPIGFFSFSKKDETHLSSGAKLNFGFIWSNYNFKIEKISSLAVDDLRIELIRKNNFHNFKKPDDLNKIWPEAFYYYQAQMVDYKKEMFMKLKGKIDDLQLTELLTFSDVDQIEKFINEKLNIAEKEKRGKYVELLEFIRFQSEKAQKLAIDDAVKEYNLYRFVGAKEIPNEIKKEITAALDQMIHNVWLFSINGGLNYARLEYFDPREGFKKKDDSYSGHSLQFNGGLFFSPKEMIGATVEYDKFGKMPKAQTIIQEYILDGSLAVPSTLLSRQVLLDKLTIKQEMTLLFEYRKYMSSFFAFNPFISFEFKNKAELDSLHCALNALFSFDQDKQWVLGIQPVIEWARNDEGILSLRRPNLGIALYLSKNLKINM